MEIPLASEQRCPTAAEAGVRLDRLHSSTEDAWMPARDPEARDRPRKLVGRLRDDDLLRRLERLNAFVARIRPPGSPLQNPLKHGSWPVRKRVGRPEPR